MSTAKQIFDEMFDKIKQMEIFEVKRNVGPNWLPMGYVPFNIKIKNNIATFEVHALTEDDAENQVTHYLNNMENEGWDG
jgi:hypothetical protein